MSAPTLFSYWRSSASYRVRIALSWKGIAYEYAAVNLLAGDQRSPEHLARNPMGYVPALAIEGALYTESLAIFELLDGLYPDTRPLFSADPRTRARQLAACHTIASGMQPLQNLSVLDKLPLDAAGKGEWVRHFVGRGFDALEAQLAASGGEGPFAFGAFSAVDACIVPQVYGARRWDVAMDAWPRVLRAHDAALALPEVAAARPEVQPDAKP